jgi:hypothetical protein
MNFKLVHNDKNSFFSIREKKKLTPVSLVESLRGGEDEIELKSGSTIQHTPTKKKEREVLYITGQSGSGKSYYTYEYVTAYQKMYPKNEVYLVSAVSDVSTIDKIKKLRKIDLSKPEFLELDVPLEELKDSMVIFDDVDSISNKHVKKKVWGLMSDILTKGRHYNVSAVITFHVATSGAETKLILNESQSITFFPSASGGRTLKYLLDSYLGLDKKQIDKIKRLDSRWCTVVKSYPKVVLYEGGAYILRN